MQAIYYVAEGDSIAAGTVGPWPPFPVVFGAQHPEVTLNVMAQGGSRLQSSNGGVPQVVNRASAVDAAKAANPGYGKYVLSLLIGVNDAVTIGEGVDDVNTFLGILSAYCDARRAAGWQVILCTQIGAYATSDAVMYPKWVAWRSTYDPTARGWLGSHCDAVADFANNATMGPVDAASNNAATYGTQSGYYWDVVHPNAAGQAKLAAPLAGAFAALT